jgi:UDP-N-acetylmuramoyl-tripeptide--D-alanyl-D-alanine ligase
MIASVLSEKYTVLKTEGNLNNYYGLPLTLCQLRPEHEVLVVEMGMSALKEIELLARLAEPEIGVVTNVGWSHLEYLKTLDNVAIAKQELIENLSGRRLAILNVDDPRVKGMARLTDQVVFFGQGEEADYRALEIHPREIEGIDVVVKAENQELPLAIPLPGEHNVYNALAAMAVGRAWGLNFTEIQAGIQKFRPSKMRMNIQTVGQGVTILNDAYNANPDSMRAGLKVLATRPGRKIAVLGDMLELGEFAESAHREIGQFAAEVGVDYLFAKGPFATQVAAGAMERGMGADRAMAFATNEALAEQLLSMVTAADTLLVKGSRGMKMEEIVKHLEEM